MAVRTHYPRSPALDGLRGVFMAAFLAFHFGATALQGMWIAINLFFVLSGFLITRLLVEEHQTWGSISFWDFYRRRGRRLLPGLFAMLTAVVLYGCLFAPEAQRHRWGGDVLSTLGFFTNWRLIAQGDEYFGDQLLPSPVRHAWTLSIEEQFYVLIPAVVLILFRLLRTRRTRVLVLLITALGFTGWTAYLSRQPGVGFPRLYYGTDTRVAALLVGTALGVALGWSRRTGIPQMSSRNLAVLGWAGLLSNVALFVTIDPFTSWMYTGGGMLLGSLGSAALVMACADRRPSLIGQIFSWRPARVFGRLSYSLYLWHWPVHLALGTSGILDSTLVTGVVGFALSTALAWASDRYLEQPVLRHGVRGLLPWARRGWWVALTPAVLIAVLAATVMLPSPTNQDLQPIRAAEPPPQLAVNQHVYQPGSPARVALIGDSVPWYLARRFPATTFPGVGVLNLAHEGCDLLDQPMATAFGVKDQRALCEQTRRTWPQALRDGRGEVAAIFGSPLLAVPHVLPDGRTGRLGTPPYDALVLATLDRLAARAQAAGARQIQIVNVPCRKFGAAPDSQEYQQIQQRTPGYIEEFEQPTKINALLGQWVRRHPEAALVDLHGALCANGFQESVQGKQLFNDNLHFSPEATPMIWRWLLGQFSHNWQQRPQGR